MTKLHCHRGNDFAYLVSEPQKQEFYFKLEKCRLKPILLQLSVFYNTAVESKKFGHRKINH